LFNYNPNARKWIIFPIEKLLLPSSF
jgi:hypothetical protein